MNVEDNIYKKCVLNASAEFLGTAFLLYFGCMGSVTLLLLHPLGSMSFGFAVLASIQMFGHISGAHLNPAVTIAAAILQQIPLIMVPFYLVAQFSGAIAGFGILMLCMPEDFDGFCLTRPAEFLTEGQAFGIEFIVTGILIFSLCAAWDKCNETKNEGLGIRLGLILAGIFMVSAPATGASLNTARTLAPAIFASKDGFIGHWVYWVAPNLSAAVIATFYRFIFMKYN